MVVGGGCDRCFDYNLIQGQLLYGSYCGRRKNMHLTLLLFSEGYSYYRSLFILWKMFMGSVLDTTLVIGKEVKETDEFLPISRPCHFPVYHFISY